MAEYIEREAVIHRIRKVATMIGFENPAVAIDSAITVIERAPTADVAPVRHGRWARIGIKGRKGLPIYPCCSVCGIVSAAFRSEWEGLRGPWKFCPNCGAKMDGDADG